MFFSALATISEARLGQPMINFNLQKDWGRIALFYLLYFRERTLPGDDDRFRLPLPVRENPVYESSAERWHGDLAVRYSHYIDSLDFGLSYFRGTSREPLFFPEVTGSAGGQPVLVLRPLYQQVQQAGIDLQYTFDAWRFKFGSIWRRSEADSFYAGVGGFEYTFYQLFDSALDLGLLLEYLSDGRDDIKLEFTARTLAASDEEDPAYFFRQDDYAEMAIRYFF